MHEKFKFFSVDTTSILRSDKGRFGTYYMETGSNQRASKVTMIDINQLYPKVNLKIMIGRAF